MRTNRPYMESQAIAAAFAALTDLVQIEDEEEGGADEVLSRRAPEIVAWHLERAANLVRERSPRIEWSPDETLALEQAIRQCMSDALVEAEKDELSGRLAGMIRVELTPSRS